MSWKQSRFQTSSRTSSAGATRWPICSRTDRVRSDRPHHGSRGAHLRSSSRPGARNPHLRHAPAQPRGRGRGAQRQAGPRCRSGDRARPQGLASARSQARRILACSAHGPAAHLRGTVRRSISEEKARTVATESSWLPREKRQQLDERMSDRLAEVGVRRLGSEVRAWRRSSTRLPRSSTSTTPRRNGA